MKRVANEKLKTKTQVVLRIPILAVLLIMATGQLAAADAPRLVLQITVDGLRGDRLDLYSENFAKGYWRPERKRFNRAVNLNYEI
jgi:hypothetical protein